MILINYSAGYNLATTPERKEHANVHEATDGWHDGSGGGGSVHPDQQLGATATDRGSAQRGRAALHGRRKFLQERQRMLFAEVRHRHAGLQVVRLQEVSHFGRPPHPTILKG